MSVLGINLMKGQFIYAVLSGTKQAPILLEKNRLITITTNYTPELVNWYEGNFSALFQRLTPSKVCYRFQLNPSKDQITYIHYPIGILNQICFNKSIPLCSHTPQGFVPSKLSLPKNTDLYAYCDHVFGSNPPYWDVNMKNAILSAWFELEE